MKHVVEVDIKKKLTFDDEHIQDLARALSQIPRVVEFLLSGEKEVWDDLWKTGWEWIPPHSWDDPDWDYGLCWHFLGDYVGVTAEA